MFRLNVDGTVDVCDDTPDVDKTGLKYMKSSMGGGKWVHHYYSEHWGEWDSKYIDESEVPKIIKMFNLLEP